MRVTAHPERRHAELLAAYANDKILHHLRCASRVASGLPAAEVHDVVQNIFAVAPGAFIAVVRQRMPGYREVDAEILLTGHGRDTGGVTGRYDEGAHTSTEAWFGAFKPLDRYCAVTSAPMSSDRSS